MVLLAFRLVASRTGPATNKTTLSMLSIKKETRNAVTLRFPVPGNVKLKAKPGQFLTFDWLVDCKKRPRSYSLSSSPLRIAYIEITVKEQGIVSSFLNREAQKGLTVEAHGPFGQFYFDETRHRSIVLFAGGSGITPIMSMLRYIEGAAPNTEIVLFYAVHTEQHVIFEGDLERFQKRLPRFRCLTIASKPASQWQGPRGHLNRAMIEHHLGEVPIKRSFFVGRPLT